jgi:hypothetical protein
MAPIAAALDHRPACVTVADVFVCSMADRGRAGLQWLCKVKSLDRPEAGAERADSFSNQ